MPKKTIKEKADEFNVVKLKKDYNNFFKKLSKIFYERDFELEQLKFAVLIGEHVLFKGTPGTAKSMLARKLFRGITGAEVYENQFTRFQDDSYVYGPQLLDEFKEGRVVHNTEGSLVQAHFGFLDEFFNASEELLVSTNEVLNERTFTRPHQKEVSPLITAVLTTNQERENEKEIQAVYDRIIFKSNVRSLADQKNRLKMYQNFIEGADDYQPKFSLDSLISLKQELENYDVEFPDFILGLFDEIINEYSIQKSENISDRKKNKMLKIVIAHAFLRDAEEVEFKDLKAIELSLVEGGDSKSADYFKSVFSKIENLAKDFKINNTFLVESMKKLYDSNLKETNVSKKYKVFLGLEEKCKENIKEFKEKKEKLEPTSMQFISTQYQILIDELEVIQAESKEALENMNSENKDLF